MMKNNKIVTRNRVMFIMIPLVLIFGASLQSCDEDGNLILPLTETEVANGLKEALKVGTGNSVTETNRLDGYYGNDAIRIPWPEEAAAAYTYIENNMSLIQPLLDEVVLLMNRGAEEASEKARPIITDAIVSMSITDAWNILNGADDAATQYLIDKTYDSLYEAFLPEIDDALESVGATTAWTQITNAYNPVASVWPTINPIETNLSNYATEKALDGLFVLIAAEELKIRTDPQARINNLLERVFGSLDD